MDTGDRLAVVDGLLALPFPGRKSREGDRTSGPGYHLRVLAASRDFWEERGAEVVESAEAGIDAALQALAAELAARWGDPEPVDLEPYLWGQGASPEPLATLCALSARMLVWRRPEAGRWVALTVGQADREFSFELLVAVGGTPMP